MFKPTKLLLCSLLFFLPLLSLAQISVRQVGNNPYQLKAADVINLIITNSSSENFQIRIIATITNSNSQVAKIETSTIEVKPGANIITPITASISKVNYKNNKIASIEKQTGSMPPGNYTVCYNIRCEQVECTINFGGPSDNQKLCYPIVIEPATPLLLNYPAHLDTIELTRPTLVWIPPMPIGSNPNISYRLKLVKKSEHQSINDAINRNRSLIDIKGIKGNTLSFPAGVEELEQNSTYAWQVDAYLDDERIVSSETWEFSLKEEENIDTVRYYIMNAGYNVTGITTNGVVYVKYDEKYMAGTMLNYKIYNDKHEEVFCLLKKVNGKGGFVEAKLERGANKLMMDFANSGLTPGYYTLEVINVKKEKSVIKILYK